MKKLLLGMVVVALLRLLIAGAQAIESREIRDIKFEFDRSEVLPDATLVLHEVAEMLRANPSHKLRLVGHTCNIGSEAYNQGLSDRRAASALAYLMNIEGITRDQVIESGNGEDNPEFSNAEESGRAQNRQVVLTLNVVTAPETIPPAASVPVQVVPVQAAPAAVDKPAVLPATVIAPALVIRTVTTSVVDANDNFIPGLVANQFMVKEAGQRKEIVQVRATMAHINSSVGLLLDCSNSICLIDLRDAVREFLAMGNPADRFLMVGFDENIKTLSTHGSDRAALLNQLDGIEREGGTHLYDAVAEVSANQMAARPAPRYLIIFSDGIDEAAGAFGGRGSTRTIEQAIAAANANGVKLLTVELGPTTAVGRQTMQNLASRTGGKSYVWDQSAGPAQFADIYRTIGPGGQNGTYTIDYRTEENSPATPVVTSTVGQIKNTQ